MFTYSILYDCYAAKKLSADVINSFLIKNTKVAAVLCSAFTLVELCNCECTELFTTAKEDRMRRFSYMF